MSTPTNRTVNIYINQENAEASLKKLNVQSDKLTRSIEAGRLAGKDMTAEMQKLADKKTAIAQLEGIMSGKMQPTLKMMRAEVTKLRNELQHMSSDAPAYAAKFESFKKASAHLKEMESSAKGVGNVIKSTFSKFMSNAGSIALGTIIGNTVQAGIQSVMSYLSGLVTGNAELSDSLADIEKTTGLTTAEVQKLNSALGKLDTRTKTKELREIAIALGQLGQEATPEAIASIDKIIVALGDEFGGGGREITTALSVLRNNLKDIQSGDYGQDVLKIGNALNVLGAEGLATAPVVTDIANRVAGVAQKFGVTSGQILGVAATFQELGIEQERGSTAFIRLMQRMTQNVDEYANIAAHAGVASKDFAELVNTDIVAALVKVAEGAKLAGGENISFGNILKDLEADGSGAGEVLSKLSQNSDLLAAKVTLATKALTETSSVTDEFNKKNNNLAANLEKIEKKMHAAFVNSNIMKGVENLVAGFGRMIGVIDPMAGKFDEFKAAEQKVKDLELAVAPLIDRYELLAGRTDLNNMEQGELNKLIAEIVKIIPSAATEFDSYGKAISISTTKVRQHTEAQRALLKLKNEDLIADTEAKIIGLQKELQMQFEHKKSLAREQERVNAHKEWIERAKEVGKYDPFWFDKAFAKTDESIAAIREKLLGLQQLLFEVTGQDNTPKPGSVLGNLFNPDVPDFKNRFKGKSGAATTITAPGGNKHLPTTYKAAGISPEQQAEVEAKVLRERAEKEYRLQLDELAKFHAGEKELLLKRQADREITDEEYHELVKQMESDHLQERLTVANDYTGEAEQAEKDAQALRTQALQDGINERQALEKTAYRDRIASLELNVLTSKKGSKDELNARKAVLQEQFDQETAHLDKTGAEYLLKQEELNLKLKDSDDQFLQNKLKSYIDIAQQIHDVFADIIRLQQQASEAALKNEVGRIEKEKNHYQKLLDEKKISQQIFNEKTEELDKEKHDKEQEHARKAFEQNKAMQLAQITINTATAIVRAWSDLGPVGAAIMTGVIAGIGGYQASVVLDQQYPEMAKGGLLDGKSHAEGGIPLVAEGGEAILSKETVRNNRALVNALLDSSTKKGGATLPDWMFSNPAAIRNDIPMFSRPSYSQMATGGMVQSNTATGGGSAGSVPAMDTHAMMIFAEAVNKFEKMTENGIRANVFYDELDKQNKEITGIKGRSSMGG